MDASQSNANNIHSLSRWTDLSWEAVVSRVYSICSLQLAGRPDIDPWDVCQEVLVIMMRRDFAARFIPAKANFWTFVGGVVWHECARAIRQARRFGHAVDSVDLLTESEGCDPAMAAEQLEFREALSRIIDRLTEKEQKALARMLNRAESGPTEQVSCRTTLYVQEWRCRQRLRQLLWQFGEDG